ncbi:hypothetical protein HZA42_04975 [Candidatus Peregrinibacteria bacterium]|nr:hypothetical protein [Candidatus Peregrinibacteria bacterium]
MGYSEQSRPELSKTPEAKTPECLPGEAEMCYPERGAQKSAAGFVENATRVLEGAQKLEVAAKINQIINFISDKLGVDWSKVDKSTADQLATFVAQGFTELNGFDKDQRWVDLKDKNGSTRTLMIRFPYPKGMEKAAKNMEMYSALVNVIQHMLGGIDWGTVTDETQERLMAAVEKGLVDIDYEHGFKPTATGYEVSLTDRRGKVEKLAINFNQKPKEEKPAPLVAERDKIKGIKDKALQERTEMALAELKNKPEAESDEKTPVQQEAAQLVDKWKGRADQMTPADKIKLFDLALTYAKEQHQKPEQAGQARYVGGVEGPLAEFAASIGVPGDYEHMDQIKEFIQGVYKEAFEHIQLANGSQNLESGGSIKSNTSGGGGQEIKKEI